MGRRGGLPRGRGSNKRQRAERWLIACNGKVTERQYFEWLIGRLGLGGRVKVDCSSAGKDPYTLVKNAAKIRTVEERRAKDGHFDPWARVFAVTDCDTFELQDAQRLAKEKGIELVVSNPCFEVWLIDHCRECPPSCAETSRCEKEARRLGLVEANDHHRAATAKRQKAVNTSMLDGREGKALLNAAAHNTLEKRMVRNSAVDSLSGYAVWTDVAGLVEALVALSQRKR